VGVLINPDNAAMRPIVRAMEGRAPGLNVEVKVVNVRRLDELDAALTLAKGQIDGVTVPDEGLFIANPDRTADLVTRSRLPSIGFREYCESGGLLAYGVDFPHIWRQAAVLVDKIFKGAKPADLPIQQATRFEFIINAKTAKALGVTIPSSIQLRADHIIE
jgi:putative ABC transport system substrate-binding protein